MSSNDRGHARPIASTFQRFLTDKGKGEDGSSGNYRTEAERELDRFLEWARGGRPDPGNADPPEEWDGILPATGERDVQFQDLDARAFGDYARYLRALDVAANTVHTYYAYVAAWSEWAHTQGFLDRHYARESEAEDPLPSDDTRRPGDQQAWTAADRDRISRYVDEQADAALDAYAAIDVPADAQSDRPADAVQDKYSAKLDAVRALRDRALALFCCYTGFRPAEFLDAPNDDREGRNGLRWSDVVLDGASEDHQPYTTIYRKRQVWKEEPLPAPLVGPLRRYKQLLDPPEGWPVFTTLHRPSLAQHVTNALAEKGYTEGEVDAARTGRPDLLTAAELGLAPPPALTPNGARRVLKRLCEEGDIAVSDGHSYLLPHGGRRGMGEVFVREFGFAEAARYLDNTERQVREAYQHIEAAERGRMATAALSQSDQRVQSPLSGDDPGSKK
jgi:integrase